MNFFREKLFPNNKTIEDVEKNESGLEKKLEDFVAGYGVEEKKKEVLDFVNSLEVDGAEDVIKEIEECVNDGKGMSDTVGFYDIKDKFCDDNQEKIGDRYKILNKVFRRMAKAMQNEYEARRDEKLKKYLENPGKFETDEDYFECNRLMEFGRVESAVEISILNKAANEYRTEIDADKKFGEGIDERISKMIDAEKRKLHGSTSTTELVDRMKAGETYEEIDGVSREEQEKYQENLETNVKHGLLVKLGYEDEKD